MLSDSPEFFKALLELNDTIMSEIRETLTLEVRESMESAFKKARDTVLRTREAEQRDTFRRILLVRNGIQKERERERSEVRD